MKRALFLSALALGGGVATSRLLGSRPDAGSEASPLPTVGPHPNGYASAPLRLGAPPDVVRDLALVALQNGLYPLYGAAESIEATPLGLDAVVALGPFRDDLSIAVLPDSGSADGSGSVVWIRSAARLGRSDLGVNRLRARRLADDLARRVHAAQNQLDGAAR